MIRLGNTILNENSIEAIHDPHGNGLTIVLRSRERIFVDATLDEAYQALAKAGHFETQRKADTSC